MKTIKKSVIVAGMTMLAVFPMHGFLSGDGTTAELVLGYAVVLPYIFMLLTMVGIISASIGDITRHFHDIGTFGWRPGGAHFGGRGVKKK